MDVKKKSIPSTSEFEKYCKRVAVAVDIYQLRFLV